MPKTTALIYFDRSAEPQGWAARYTVGTAEESCEFGGTLDEEAPLQRLLDAPDCPRALRDLTGWRPVQHDGPAFEVRS